MAFTIAYYLKCSYDDNISRFNIYRDNNYQQWFVREVERITDEVNDIQSKSMEPLNTTRFLEHSKAKVCYICEQAFADSTGFYRGIFFLSQYL